VLVVSSGFAVIDADKKANDEHNFARNKSIGLGVDVFCVVVDVF